MKDNNAFQMTITSERKLLDFNLRELIRYRDLIYLFVKRDFTSLYKQTILGPLWAIIQPLLTTVVFTVIFGNLARLTTADVSGTFVIPGFLFYMSGSICWTYFANTLNETSGTFIRNRKTMGKVYYPRLAAPIATACSNLIAFAVQLIMFFGFWLYFLLQGGTAIRITPMLLLICFVFIMQLMGVIMRQADKAPAAATAAPVAQKGFEFRKSDQEAKPSCWTMAVVIVLQLYMIQAAAMVLTIRTLALD